MPRKNIEWSGTPRFSLAFFRLPITAVCSGAGETLAPSEVEGRGRHFLVIYIKYEIDNPAGLKAQIGYGKDQVGDGAGVAHALYLDMPRYRLYAHVAVEVPGFYPETVPAEFPQVVPYADYDGEMGMYAGKFPGDDGIKGPYDGKFAAVFLGKIAKGKKFNFH
jgi:hypothetical protein